MLQDLHSHAAWRLGDCALVAKQRSCRLIMDEPGLDTRLFVVCGKSVEVRSPRHSGQLQC